MYYVYMLRCEGQLLYTGITTDVERRFSEHKEGNGKGARYTKAHKPLGIEAVWEAESRSSASKLEYRLKKLSKEEKEALIVKREEVLALDTQCREIIFKRLR